LKAPFPLVFFFSFTSPTPFHAHSPAQLPTVSSVATHTPQGNKVKAAAKQLRKINDAVINGPMVVKDNKKRSFGRFKNTQQRTWLLFHGAQESSLADN
jgi:hypothetical protein